MGFAERSDSFDFSEYDIVLPNVLSSRPSAQMLPFRITQSAFRNHDVRLVYDNSRARRWKARLNPETSEDEPSPHLPAGPKKDYSLKEGQTFSIAIPGRAKAGSGANLLSSGVALLGESKGGGIPLLPPPPSAPKKRS